MPADQGTRRGVLLGAAMGAALLVLEAGETRLGLGGATALVSLVPVALALVLGGPVGAGVAVLVAVAGAAALLGGTASAMVALRHALPGVVLGVALGRRLSLPVSLLVVGAVSLASLAVLVWAFVPSGPGAFALVEQQIQAHVADWERVLGSLGMPSDPGRVAESTRLVATTMRVAGPAVLLVWLLLGALTNYVGARLCLRGGGFRPFAEEAVPDHLVWAVIAGGLMLLSGSDALASVGLNLLIVLVALYAIQGLAVLRHFFQKVRVPRTLQGVSFGLFVVQPLLLIAVACLGLSDLWVDFRKIRQAPTPA